MTILGILQDLERHGLGNILRLALERYKRDETLGRVSKPLNAADALALERLLGKPVRTLDLQALDHALYHSKYGVGLLEVLQSLNQAPIVSAKSQRLWLERTFETALERVFDLEWRSALGQGEAGASRLKRALKEGQDPQTLPLEWVCAALVALRQNPQRLPSLATQVAGHAHALDSDTLAGQVLLDALEALQLEPPMRDGVSSSVLIAHLYGFNCVHLPWREVIQLPPESRSVLLLENPAVFEALLDAGSSQPMLCSSGQPSAACIALLDRLEGQIYFAADFDLGGLRIARRIQNRYPQQFTPWHFDAAAYQMALERSGGFALTGALTAPLEPFQNHFPELVRLMQHTGRGAHQEALLELFCDSALRMG
jgi:hypothetical protein